MKTDFNLVKYLKGFQQLLAQVHSFSLTKLTNENRENKTKTVWKERKETESERQGRTNQV